MAGRIVVMTLGLALLSGCAQLSFLNPFTWFGRSTEVVVGDTVPGAAAAPARPPLIPPGQENRVFDARTLAAEIVALEVIRVPQGALIQATGRAASAGSYNADLVEVARGGGQVVYRLRLSENPGGGPVAQRVEVARLLSGSELAGIRSIRVESATNAREVRR